MALLNKSPQCYVMPLAIWDHIVLPDTRHKLVHPALTQSDRLVLDLLTMEEWKAELTYQQWRHLLRPGPPNILKR